MWSCNIYKMATKFKGGWDCDFVEPPGECLECSICLLTLRDPHVSSCCGHHFCWSCISRVKGDNRSCPLCNEADFTTLLHKGVQRTINGLQVYCKWKRLGCEWQGELGQLDAHLEAREMDGCGLVLVECAYQCGKMVERRHIPDHELEECPKRPIEAQMSSLAKKLEARLTIAEQKLESEHSEREDMKGRLSNLEEQNKSLTEENKALRNELEAVKRITTHSTEVPPFYYTLYNYKHHKAASVVLFSPPFYSHPGGYKMRLQLYPNGTKHGKNKHLSVFVGIMLGEFDADLKWPFGGRVSVEIYNCAKKEWDTKPDFTFIPRQSDRIVQRPVNCVANDATGTITWLSHDELFTYYVIPGYDFVRFRVTKVDIMT